MKPPPLKPLLPHEEEKLLRLLALGPNVPANIVGAPPRQDAPGAVIYPQDLGSTPKVLEQVPRDLRSLSREYVLFNHFLMCFVGELAVDPVELWWAEVNLPPQERPGQLVTTSRLVIGPPEPWGRTLYACPVNYWDGLSQALRETGGRNRATGRFWQAVAQKLPVAARSDLGEPEAYYGPQVEAYWFGVDGTDGLWCYEPSRQGPAVVRKRSPSQSTLELAAKAMQTG